MTIKAMCYLNETLLLKLNDLQRVDPELMFTSMNSSDWNSFLSNVSSTHAGSTGSQFLELLQIKD